MNYYSCNFFQTYEKDLTTQSELKKKISGQTVMKLDVQINKSMVASKIYCKLLLNFSHMEETFIKKFNF